MLSSGVYWFENKSYWSDKYTDTSGGSLIYKRNLLEHGHSYLDKTNMMVDIDEMELFAAWTLDDVLPSLLKMLLPNRNMTSKFAGVWSAFCSMQSGSKLSHCSIIDM